MINLNNIWFFIANPRIANWEDSETWIKHEKKYNWGIPMKSRDLEKLSEVMENDIILCYTAIKKELIGCCRCTLTRYKGNIEKEDVNPEFINRIGISKIKYRTPIMLEELKSMRLKFIDEYLKFPRGRSIVKVSTNDWNKLRDFQDC